MFSYLFSLFVSFGNFAFFCLFSCPQMLVPSIRVTRGHSAYSLQVASLSILASTILFSESSPDLLGELKKVVSIIFTQMPCSTSPSKCSKLMSFISSRIRFLFLISQRQWMTLSFIQLSHPNRKHKLSMSSITSPLSSPLYWITIFLHLNSENISSFRPP